MFSSKSFKLCVLIFQECDIFTSFALQKYTTEKIIMGKQAILFKLLVEYFGESEESIESYIISNVEERISILLKEIINKISNSKRRKLAVVSDGTLWEAQTAR